MIKQFGFICTRFIYSFRSVASGLQRPCPLARAVGHAAAFVVNAALVVGQRQRDKTLALNLPCGEYNKTRLSSREHTLTGSFHAQEAPSLVGQHLAETNGSAFDSFECWRLEAIYG